MTDQDIVKISLHKEDAERFKKFLEHYEKFNLLLDRGVFEVKNGSVVLDFDKNSVLQTIRLTGYMYSRRHETKRFVEPSVYISL